MSTKVSIEPLAGTSATRASIGELGRASTPGLLALVLLLGLGGAVAAWYAWDARAGSVAGGGAVSPDPAAASQAPVRTDLGRDEPRPAPRADAGTRPGARPSAAPSAGASVASNLGTIRGSVHTAPGQTLPATWRAVVEPSPFYQGDHSGVRRTVELAGDEHGFAIEELPLAGYSVRAEAAGFNSLPVHVLLTAGSEMQIVNLVLSPAGFLDGFVLDAKGRPVEELLVTLEAEADSSRRGVTTQSDGSFVFPDVLDGNYTLYFGAPEAPLVAPKSLAFQAPSMRAPETELPVLGKLALHTFDRDGTPLALVDVRGFGSEGGQINALTDENGKATIGLLRPGRYRLFASTEDGRESRTHVDVVADETVEIELRLHEK